MLKNIFIAILLVLVGALGYAFFQDKFIKTKTNTFPAVSPTTATSPNPTITVQVTVTSSPTTSNQESVKKAIKKQFSKKYNKPEDQIEIKISKIEGRYATGNVRFTDEISGAMWLAFNNQDSWENDMWKIVFDGQGTISCEVIEPYNFPTNMAPECVDKNGNLIQR